MRSFDEPANGFLTRASGLASLIAQRRLGRKDPWSTVLPASLIMAGLEKLVDHLLTPCLVRLEQPFRRRQYGRQGE